MKKNIVHDPLSVVVARFPEFEERIKEKFQADEQFQELCADHAECLAMLRHYQEQSARPFGRIEDYTEMRVSLEQELADRISEPSNDHSAAERIHRRDTCHDN